MNLLAKPGSLLYKSTIVLCLCGTAAIALFEISFGEPKTLTPVFLVLCPSFLLFAAFVGRDSERLLFPMLALIGASIYPLIFLSLFILNTSEDAWNSNDLRILIEWVVIPVTISIAGCVLAAMKFAQLKVKR